MANIATNLDQVYRALRIAPIPQEKITEQYVDLASVRGENPVWKVKRRLNEEPKGRQQMIFVGYRGCGKSTELNKLSKEIEDDFLILKFSVVEESDLFSLNFVKLFIFTMQRLFDLVEKNNLNISQAYMDNIRDFLQEESIERVRDAYMGTEFKTGVETTIGIPYLHNFFAKLMANAKASSSIKQKILENIQPSISELLFNCNALIEEIKISHLRTLGKEGMLIIIEDLDKLPLDQAKKLFFDNGLILTKLNVNVIFTFPISLLYNNQFNIIKNNFHEDFCLPMVKVRTKSNEVYEKGIECLKNVIKKRISIHLFEEERYLNELIDYSGGCLRDLFRMTIDAADRTLEFGKEKIGATEVRYGKLKLKQDYENSIADKMEGNQVLVSVDDYFDTLIELYNNPQKNVKNSNIVFDLRQNLCILEYNTEGWCDLHPAVKKNMFN